MTPRRAPQPVEHLPVTTTQAAVLLGLSTSRVRALARSGVLPSTATASGHRRYTLSDVQRVAQARADWQCGVALRRRTTQTNTDTPEGGE